MRDRREKLHSNQPLTRWIYEHAKGDRVLVIGPAYCVDVIQFARESKQLLYMVESKKQMEDAHQQLIHENEATKKCATVIHGNLFTHAFEDLVFDSIVFEKSLKEVTEPERYVRVAASLLRADGQMIVTLPFGINEKNEQTEPYYLSRLQKFATGGLTIANVTIVDGDIGVILRKAAGNSVDSSERMEQLEEAFYAKEIRHLEAIEAYKSDYEQLEDGRHKEDGDVLELQKEKVDAQKKLLAAYRKEEEVLVEYKKLLKKYEALSTSKLGKATLAYWRWRRRKK